MVTFISRSPEETAALGEAWGRAARRGLVIGLSGELGAGKTQLVKGLARGLGISTRITSPSFALVNEHHGGRLPLFHLDFYRLNSPEEIVAAGLEGYLFDPEGVTVVEWVERWLGEGAISDFKSEISNPVESERPNPFKSGNPDRFRSDVSERSKSGMAGWAGRLAVFEVVSETERRIWYEDSGP